MGPRYCPLMTETAPRRRTVHHHARILFLAGTLVCGVVLFRTYQNANSAGPAIALPIAAMPAQSTAAGGTSTATRVPIAADVTGDATTKIMPAAETPDEVTAASEQPSTSTDPAADQRALLLGRWVDEFYGRRIFDFRDDGTATMVLELDAIGKMLYGPKLTFFVDWQLHDGVLSLKMTGGEPDGTAVKLAKLFGESSEQRLEAISTEELQLRSLDSQTLYTHKRLEAESQGTATPPTSR
jgi:hypothetical protein